MNKPSYYIIKIDKQKIISRETTSIPDDIVVEMIECEQGITVNLQAKTTPVEYIQLVWEAEITDKNALFMGDTWERNYATMHWEKENAERIMPWYFLCQTDKEVKAYGVKTQPNAFCSWKVNGGNVILTLDVRNGGQGIVLDSRKLQVATVLFNSYEEDAFFAGKKFCKLMCDNPIFPKEWVYGSNNWYYAYGISSHQEILEDTEYIAQLTQGLEPRPYMVIDACWNECVLAGPWDRVNERFIDMKLLADQMKAKGVKPGIWYRPLCTTEILDDDCYLMQVEDGKTLDPTHPKVKEKLINDVKRFIEWGYELIKYDYSTYDIIGRFCFKDDEFLANESLSFYDKTKTTAEIIKDLYALIKENSGDCVLIGCNTISHLCAGYVHVNRVGDDTSGKDWNVTKCMGVNTMAFRMIQDKAFYVADADCVGITEKIQWKLNINWLTLVACSNSPLFISSKKGVANQKQVEEIKKAYQENVKNQVEFYPLDWQDNSIPSKWNIKGEEVVFDWDNGTNE